MVRFFALAFALAFAQACTEPPAEVMARPGYCELNCSDTSDSDTGIWSLCGEDDCIGSTEKRRPRFLS